LQILHKNDLLYLNMSGASKFEQDPRIRPQPELPDDLDEAIRVLEHQHFADVADLEQTVPSPLDPISLHIAYRIAYSRVRADGEVIEDLHHRNYERIQAESEHIAAELRHFKP
jgi:hypothetical protein